MAWYVQADGDGRLLAASEDGASLPGAALVALPDGFDFDRMTDWVLRDGALALDPAPPSPEQAAAEEAARAAAEREAWLASAPGDLDDALEAVAELGAMVDGTAVTMEEVLDAVAELGSLLAAMEGE